MRSLRQALRRCPFLADESGAPVVEFAIVAPFLMLVTVGIIDIGRAVWTATTIEHVAREGARYASVHGAGHVSEATAATVETFVEDRATGLAPADVNVNVSWAGGSNASGSSVTVQVTYDFNLLLAGFLQFDPISLGSQSTMIVL